MQQRPVRKRLPRLTMLLAGVGLGAALCGSMVTAATTSSTKTKAPAGTSARATSPKAPATPAPAAKSPPAGFEQMSQLAFLTGSWIGHLQAMPIFMDIAIHGSAEQPGGPIKFKIKATPPANSFVKLGLEGDYNAVAAYSTTQKAVRAVVTDVSGHGVEMIGEPDGKPTAWLFNSTAQGAPFPFKVRVTSVSADQILVNYSSGGRMPLTYEVTFNRVTG